ncbi:MAG: Fur family transcriptional regulator [Spirochaetota bacterium]
MRGRGYGRHRGGGEGPFRTGGFRRTAPRQAVLEVVREADDYLSADEVYRRVFERLQGIGIATVYRTLLLLTELGILNRIVSDEGKALYRFADDAAANHRVMLVCRRCSRRRAVSIKHEPIRRPLEAFHEAIAREHAFSIEQSVHQIFGLCDDCSQETEAGHVAE